jgi:hypothetical protein
VLKISVQHNFPQVMRAVAQLEKDMADRVMARALNRTIEEGRTDMSREIRSEFNLSASKVREKLFIEKASFKGGRLTLQAALVSKDPRGRRRSINLINFAARQTSKGVTVKIKKGGGRKTLPGAFIANKGRTVFKRQGKARLPIQPVQTIDVQQMFNTRRINAAVVRRLGPKFVKNFEHELRFALTTFGSRR